MQLAYTRSVMPAASAKRARGEAKPRREIGIAIFVGPPAHPACWQQVRAAQRITGGDHRGKDDGKERGRASDAGSNADTDENAPTMEPMPIMVAPKTPTCASMFRLSSQSEVQDIWLEV